MSDGILVVQAHNPSTSVNASLDFTEPSLSGAKFSLCYAFEEEPYKLYSGIQLTVASIASLLTKTFVVDQAKLFNVFGSGVSAGLDKLKFVSSSTFAGQPGALAD